MKPAIYPGKEDVLHAVKYQPCVSVILPFEPKMSVKNELEVRLKTALHKVQRDLSAAYPGETVKEITSNLQALMKGLDYSTYKKSIAFFVSPVFKKVYYLDIVVEEKIIIDDSFEIRDLVYSKKEIHKYLVLLISGKQSKIFLGNTSAMIPIALNVPEHVEDYTNDIPERVSNFSDPQERKDIMLNKFLKHIDKGLSIIINAYPLPLFVMGAKRTIGRFKKVSHNLEHIIDYVHGNFDGNTEQEIQSAIRPYVENWKTVLQKDLLHRLENAMSAHKLAIGMRDVWKEASRGQGRLLIVEKNYRCPARQGVGGKDIYPYEALATENTLYIKDAVDDVVEKVLENGGDVEFVDEGILKDYAHIAMIRYY